MPLGLFSGLVFEGVTGGGDVIRPGFSLSFKTEYVYQYLLRFKGSLGKVRKNKKHVFLSFSVVWLPCTMWK